MAELSCTTIGRQKPLKCKSIRVCHQIISLLSLRTAESHGSAAEDSSPSLMFRSRKCFVLPMSLPVEYRKSNSVERMRGSAYLVATKKAPSSQVTPGPASIASTGGQCNLQ